MEHANEIILKKITEEQRKLSQLQKIHIKAVLKDKNPCIDVRSYFTPLTVEALCLA